jgi:hypothetical protein
MAVTGDGQYIVYATASAIYAVSPGSQPFLIANGQYCNNVRMVPNTNDEVVYYCSKSNTKKFKETIYQSNVSTKKSAVKTTAIYTTSGSYSQKIGTTDNYINSFRPSPDGSSLALNLRKDTITATCKIDSSEVIDTLPIKTASTTSTLYNSPSVSLGGCAGGGGGDIDQVVWSPNGNSIAYLNTLGDTTTLNLLTSINSNVASKQLANYAGGISW